MKKITIARGTIWPFETKLAKIFKDDGYEVNSVSIYEPSEEKKEVFDNCYYMLDRKLRNKQNSKIYLIYTILLIIKNIRKILKPLKTDIIIGISEPNAFIYFVFLLSNAVHIYFPYDIPFFRYKQYKKNLWYDRYFEKYNFKKCEGIIHKGTQDELDHLPTTFEASKKPNLQFLPYCCENDFLPLKHKKEGREIHLVYVGLVYLDEEGTDYYPLSKTFSSLVFQKYFVDVYPVNYDAVCASEEYKEIQQNKYFTLHKPIYGKKFKEELSKYDWGLYILFFNMDIIKQEWTDTVFGNKIGDYLEAGLPVITNKELSFVTKIIEEYDIGISVDFWKIDERIQNIAYKDIQKKVNVNRKKFTMSANKDRLLAFVRDIK